MQREKVYTEIWWGNPSERYHLESLGVDEKIILKESFKKWNGAMHWVNGSIKCEEVFQ
jgi:hypothetical protein